MEMEAPQKAALKAISLNKPDSKIAQPPGFPGGFFVRQTSADKWGGSDTSLKGSA